MGNQMKKPINRSKFRSTCGMIGYSLQRYALWIMMNHRFAKDKASSLPYQIHAHKTILMRELHNVDMQLQINKITNLKIVAEKLNGIIIRPHEVFSYWQIIGRVSDKYLEREWRATQPNPFGYEIIERNHQMCSEYCYCS